MFSDYKLIMVYKSDHIDEDDWRGDEWQCVNESVLRREIAKTIINLNLDISLEDEIYTAYNKMLKDCYELPNCRFELIRE